MTAAISARTVVAGVTGSPIRHSLSPSIHNAWLRASGIDGVYVAFEPGLDAFQAFAMGLRGGIVRGLNITAPFKEPALALADRASDRARRAGSANLLLFETDGSIHADNTDGEGLLWAFNLQAPEFRIDRGPILILGAGGAARGAAAAFLDAGAPAVVFINRTSERGSRLATTFGNRTRSVDGDAAMAAFAEAAAVVNATPLGLGGGEGPGVPLERLPSHCVVMDMIYRPVRTRLLRRAVEAGLNTVDGLAMLVGQAAPSFEALFGLRPPPVDVYALAALALENDPS
jgi:shikimate dehydrogenase